MRSINDVLRDKELRLQTLKDEIEKLQIAARILAEEGEPAPASETARPVIVNKNWP